MRNVFYTKLLITAFVLLISQTTNIACYSGQTQECNEIKNCDINCARSLAISLSDELLTYQHVSKDLKGQYATLSSIILLLENEKDLDEILIITLGQMFGYRWLINEELGHEIEARKDLHESITYLKQANFLDPNLDESKLRYYLERMIEINTEHYTSSKLK